MHTPGLTRPRLYWCAVAALGLLVALGIAAYSRQLASGMQITGLSRDIAWGLYISQFTFLVGVAASAVMVVLPYYLHGFEAFGKLTVIAEFLAVAALLMCLLFVFVDMGRPARVLNVLLNPSPGSLMFWDLLVLAGYLLLNLVLLRTTLVADRYGVPLPAWVRSLVYISIPWAFGIHTVTALLYAGLSAKPAWMTAILAPRFLASAFASGPALLIILALILRWTTRIHVEAIDKLGEIVAYAMTANVLFTALEMFTALYSGIPDEAEHFEYLFVGFLAPWAWASTFLAIVALAILLVPKARRNAMLLAVACLAVVGSVWIDKGLCMIVAGFAPTPLGDVTEYWPTLPEISIAAGIYAAGSLVLLVPGRWVLARREQQ
ncbi:MAG: polysulfide reductase NrfD [Acidobacteria bacterium]|nr:polysulfide reductase NrfD [Acidobacteriota bacterium]